MEQEQLPEPWPEEPVLPVGLPEPTQALGPRHL
jgi:hypothetical protein